MRTRILYVALFTAAVPFGPIGCSIPATARQTALTLSVRTEKIQTQIAAFADAQLEVDTLRLRSLQETRRQTTETVQERVRDLGLWKARAIGATNPAPEIRTALFDAVRESSDRAAEMYRRDRAAADEDAKALAGLRAAVKVDADGFAKVAKEFAGIAEKRTLISNAGFLFAYAKDVDTKIERLKDDAKKAAAAAKAP